MNKLLFSALPLALFTAPVAAQDEAPSAPLPEAAGAMIDAAIANGDADDVEAVIEAARAAFPANVTQIDAIWSRYQAEQAELAAAAAAAEEAEIRQASLFDNWNGQGQIGGFASTGNSEEVGVTAALALNRQGIDWEHRLRFSADYRRDNGVTTREQFLARYEPRYQINERLFAFGLAQYERDSRQGFSGRYSVSGGLGYRLVDNENMHLNVQAGPAYRVTEFSDGTSSSRIAGLVGLDFDWQLSDSIKFTQDANSTVETGGEALLVVDSANTSLTAVTGLEAQINSSLSARVSWAVEYDSNPPAGAVSTDTVTRFTLIYGF